MHWEYEESWQEDQYSPSADYFAKGDRCVCRQRRGMDGGWNQEDYTDDFRY